MEPHAAADVDDVAMDIGVDIVDISAILKIKNSQLKGVGFTYNTV